MGAIAVEPIAGAVTVRARVLGAGTSVRFALLLLFIAADSLSLLSTVDPSGTNSYQWWLLCTLATGIDPTQPYVSGTEIANNAFIQSCQAAHGVRSSVAWTAIGTAAVFVLATAIYLLSPVWRRRRGRLLPIDLASADELAPRLRELVTQTGLQRTPEFAIDPMARTASAVVFGRLGRYTVCLDAGLIARDGKDPGVLRDVVLHELAHIRNRDVDITYATVALWRAFLICAVLPNLVGAIYPLVGQVSITTALEIWRDQWQLQLRGVLRAIVLVALTYLVRADILRTRELYADIDAARRAGPSALSWLDRRQANRPRFAGWQRFLGRWRTHPGWLERNRSMIDPAILFGVTALPMFLTGVTAEVANSTITLVSQGFGLPLDNVVLTELPTWLTAALVVGIAGYALWRAVSYAVLTGRPVPSGWRAGLWLGIGMAVGELVTFRTAGVGLLPPKPAILLAFVVGAPVFTWWVAQCAELWVRGCRGGSLRPVQFLGLAAAFVVFGTWYGYWMTESYLLLIGLPNSPQLAALGPGEPPWFSIIAGLANQPMIFAGATIFWLFPLFALLRRPVIETPAWVLRAGLGTANEGMPSGYALPLRRVALAAVFGGMLCWLSAVLVMLCLHLRQPPPEGRNEAWTLSYFDWLMVGLGAATVLTAITVAAITRRQRLTVALFASGGAALIGFAGLFFLAAIDGCVGPMQVMASTCVWRPLAAWNVVTAQVPFILSLGIYLAAIGALVSAAVTDAAGLLFWLAPRRQARPSSQASTTVRRLAVLTACALVAALSVNTALNYWRTTGVDLTGTITIGAEPPRTDATVKLEVYAWLQVGGSDKIARLQTDFQRLGKVAIAEANAAAQAGQQTLDIDLTVWIPLCAAEEHDANDAKTFVPIPDDQAQALWATTLTTTARSGADCQRALRQGDDTLFGISLTEGSSAPTDKLSHRIDAIENGA